MTTKEEFNQKLEAEQLSLLMMLGEAAGEFVDMPWPELEIPDYRVGEYGKWWIEISEIPIVRGYFRGWQEVRHDNYALMDENGTTWMSVTPMELESHMPHVAAASGHTVVIGAGLGLFLYNVMKKESVDRVTVIEKDPDVAELVSELAKDWIGHENLKIIVADALQFGGFSEMAPVDFLYVDISEHLMDEAVLGHTQLIQSKLQARHVGFWGEELEFIIWLRQTGRKPPPTEQDWKNWKGSHGLPIFDHGRDWFWAYQAATQAANY